MTFVTYQRSHAVCPHRTPILNMASRPLTVTDEIGSDRHGPDSYNPSRFRETLCVSFRKPVSAKTSASAADRVFLDRRGTGVPSVVHAGPGGRASGWPGRRQAGAWRPRMIRARDGRQPGGHPAGSGHLRQVAMPGNVAVDPAGAVPARRGAGGCNCPAVRALLSRAGHAE